MNDYLNMRIGTRGRLVILKRMAEKINVEMRRVCPENDYTWRDVRRSGFHNSRENPGELSSGFNGKKSFWYCHTGPAFPRERFADECESAHSIDHQGWYTDDERDNAIRGLVVALPHGRFLAGYYMSDNGERGYYPDLYDDERTAAYAADSLAQNLAEEEHAYNVRLSEARELENERDEKTQRLRECLTLRNNHCFVHLRREALRLIERIREIREGLANDYADCM